MELQPDPLDPEHVSYVTYETRREYDLVHPYRFRRAVRRVLETATIVLEPLQFPLYWSVSNEVLRRRDNFLLETAFTVQTTRPGGLAVQAELLGLHDKLQDHLRTTIDTSKTSLDSR